MPPRLATTTEKFGDLPISDALNASVFYPACGLDGDPIEYLGGTFHSVYVDYGVRLEGLANEFDTFRGYRFLASRSVSEREWVPNGWTVRFPHGYVPNKSPGHWFKPLFAQSIIYQRQDSFGFTHGPQRFSQLYVSGDRPATFQALYHSCYASPVDDLPKLETKRHL